MGLKETFKNLTNVQMMRYKTAYQKGRNTKLENRLQKLEFLIRDDILSMIDSTTTYTGNAYPSYGEAVAEIDRKYRGVADWGVLQTGNIIDLRAAFIIGDGIKVSEKVKGEGKEELKWANKFLEYNDLDQEVAQEFAKEAEIEGKIALKLAIEDIEDKDFESMVSARYISWTAKKYTVVANPKDYLDYQKLIWQAVGVTKEETLEAKEFVYKKFGGRINDPNEAAPKIMKCLTEIESLDKAERDWREIDHIFAGPILYALCKDKREVTEAVAAISDKNFKLKKALAGTFDLKFLSLDIKGVEALENEIITLAKMISGTTGIPVHFLGLAELMSNRATAENLMELINASTTKERQTWIGAYEETITKAMNMWNDKVNQGKSEGAKLDPSKIKVEIPIITQAHYDRIEKVFLPAAIAGKISDEALLEKMPGIEAEEEMERKEAKEASEFETIKRENEDLKADNLERNLLGREENEE